MTVRSRPLGLLRLLAEAKEKFFRLIHILLGLLLLLLLLMPGMTALLPLLALDLGNGLSILTISLLGPIEPILPFLLIPTTTPLILTNRKTSLAILRPILGRLSILNLILLDGLIQLFGDLFQ